MKGSTVDAMGDAVDNAEVMLFCVSLAYKESANVRNQEEAADPWLPVAFTVCMCVASAD